MYRHGGTAPTPSAANPRTSIASTATAASIIPTTATAAAEGPVAGVAMTVGHMASGEGSDEVRAAAGTGTQTREQAALQKDAEREKALVMMSESDRIEKLGHLPESFQLFAIVDEFTVRCADYMFTYTGYTSYHGV